MVPPPFRVIDRGADLAPELAIPFFFHCTFAESRVLPAMTLVSAVLLLFLSGIEAFLKLRHGR